MLPAGAYLDGLVEMDPKEWRSMLSGVCLVGYDGVTHHPERPYEKWIVRMQERMADEWASSPPEGHETWAMHRVGKKTAGRVLDGRTWDEFPDGPLWIHDWQDEITPPAGDRAERRRRKCARCGLSISMRAMTSGRCQPRAAAPPPRQLEILS